MTSSKTGLACAVYWTLLYWTLFCMSCIYAMLIAASRYRYCIEKVTSDFHALLDSDFDGAIDMACALPSWLIIWVILTTHNIIFHSNVNVQSKPNYIIEKNVQGVPFMPARKPKKKKKHWSINVAHIQYKKNYTKIAFKHLNWKKL